MKRRGGQVGVACLLLLVLLATPSEGGPKQLPHLPRCCSVTQVSR